MTKQMALKLWDDIFDKALWAQDCYGTWVYRNDYGDHETTRKRPGAVKRNIIMAGKWIILNLRAALKMRVTLICLQLSENPHDEDDMIVTVA